MLLKSILTRTNDYNTYQQESYKARKSCLYNSIQICLLTSIAKRFS